MDYGNTNIPQARTSATSAFPFVRIYFGKKIQSGNMASVRLFKGVCFACRFSLTRLQIPASYGLSFPQKVSHVGNLMCASACMYTCGYMCVRACVRVCVCVCVKFVFHKCFILTFVSVLDAGVNHGSKVVS